jgi:hypothetical protein
MKNGPFTLRTKNRRKTENNHLTGKAPYKFESTSLQQRVCELSVLEAAELEFVL